MFEYCAKNFSNKKETLEWVNAFENSLHDNLLHPLEIISEKEYVCLFAYLDEAKKSINSNVSSRFVMENFFLKYSQFLAENN